MHPPAGPRASVAALLLLLGACAPPLAPAVTPAPAPAPRPAASAPPRPVPAAAPVAAAADAIAADVVAESLLVDVQRVDATIAVDVRYATPYNFVGEVLPGYEAPRVLLRREAADALGRVQAALRAEGVGLRVFDGYRPVRATAAMVAWTRRVKREDLLRDGYIAERSRHNLGLAVDVTLVDLATGRELRMGTAFDTFSRAAHTANATGEAAVNRQRLVRAMRAEGFVNLPEEWWHFSYDVPDPLRFDLVIRPARDD
ncbi:MAG: M15 family metallopeptidase [Gemmatirosa sp.]